MSTETVVAAVRDASSSKNPLRISGRGCWLDAGRPVAAQTTLSLRDDSGVVSYVPGDLTLTVLAGTTLEDIQRVTAEHNQWLPLDPYGSNTGTIGATIATASSGPLTANFGLARDLVLGLEFVTGRAEVIRSGGKVVKNVAGFDLSRLLTGSWGTLGVITEVTLRLYARPTSDRTVVVRLPKGAKECTAFLRAFLTAPVSPFSFELLSGSTSSLLEIDASAVALARFGGNAQAVDAQLRALNHLAKSEEIDASIWDRLRNLESDAECVVRVSGLPARFCDASATILADSFPEILTYINPIRGSLRVVMRAQPGEMSADAVAAIDPGAKTDEHLVFEKLPPEVWSTVPSAVGDSLSRGIKNVYDPQNILNPGILGN